MRFIAKEKANMKIRILKLKQLNRRQLRALSKLTDDCSEHDETHYGVPEDADAYYLLYEGDKLAAAAAIFLMGESLNERKVYELAAFTAPKSRRRAYYSRLISAMRLKLSGCCVRYAVYGNEAALGTLNARGAVHSHDELMLSLALHSEKWTSNNAGGKIDAANNGTQKHEAKVSKAPEAIPEENKASDTPGQAKQSDAANIDYAAGHAQNAHSECYFRLSEDGSSAYVYGVLTYANYLKKGYALSLLKTLFGELAKHGVLNVSLQVSSENEPALKLYEKLGMKESERLCMYYEII